MDGTFVIERPCNAYYFLEKARQARPRLDPRLACRARCRSSEMLLEALRLSRAKIHQSTTSTPTRLSKAIPPFSRPKHPPYSQQPTHPHPTCPTTAAAATMSPWTTPWESAPHFRAKSRKSLVADNSTGRTRTTSSTRTTSWSKISMGRTAMAEPTATWTMTWTTLSRAAT